MSRATDIPLWGVLAALAAGIVAFVVVLFLGAAFVVAGDDAPPTGSTCEMPALGYFGMDGPEPQLGIESTSWLPPATTCTSDGRRADVTSDLADLAWPPALFAFVATTWGAGRRLEDAAAAKLDEL